MGQLLKSREKTQLIWGIQLFRIFSVCIARHGIILPTQYEEIKKELNTILEKVIYEDFNETSAENFNSMIMSMNELMKKKLDIVRYAPFPLFSFAITESLKANTLVHLDMVQRTLNETAKASILDWGKEGSHFYEVLMIYTDVERGLPSKEAIDRLAAEIDKINKNLAPEFHFPMPESSVYE